MTDTQEIARIRAAMESGVTGWGNVNTCWITGEDDDGNEGLNIVGAVIEDEMYPVLEIDTAQYFAEAEGPKLAEYYAACNPAAMTALLAHIDAQAAEVDRLGRLIKAVQNTDAAAQQAAEIERLRADAAR